MENLQILQFTILIKLSLLEMFCVMNIIDEDLKNIPTLSLSRLAVFQVSSVYLVLCLRGIAVGLSVAT